MKLLIQLLILTFFSFSSFANSETFNCKITNFGNISKGEKTWIPNNFILNPNEKYIELNGNEKINAELKTYTKTRLEMIHHREGTYGVSKMKTPSAKYTYTYLPLIDKVSLIVRMSGFVPIGPVMGSCLIKKSEKTLNSQSNTTKKIQSTNLKENSSNSSFNSNLNSSSSKNNLNDAKFECSDIGYKKGTEKFADCVMKLIEK